MTIFILGASAISLGLVGLFLHLRHSLSKLKYPGLAWLSLTCIAHLGIIALARRFLS